MNGQVTSTLTSAEAAKTLGVATDASEAQVRAAYLSKVTQYPPDREPEQFERIRDAYQLLRDPRRLILQILEAPDPYLPFSKILDSEPTAQRRFVGPDLWMALLKEKRP